MKGAKYAKPAKPTTLLTLIAQGYDPDLEALIKPGAPDYKPGDSVIRTAGFGGGTGDGLGMTGTFSHLSLDGTSAWVTVTGQHHLVAWHLDKMTLNSV